MQNDLAMNTVERINRYLSSRPWFDFEVMHYQGYRLTIMGGIDPSAAHEVEIWFEDVFFISGPMEWKTDTSTPAVSLLSGGDAIDLNRRFQVEQGHHIFRFSAEDYPESASCLVAAREIGFKVVVDEA
ncbi:MAG: hypothetical protein H6741_22965 [Alphaproteobacteria bacterium]|nr:hypothetical protein [Alphaproteobacteria bacterium]